MDAVQDGEIDSLLALPRGAAVWVLVPAADTWQPAALLSTTGAGKNVECTVQLHNGSSIKAEAKRVAPANPDILAACPDITRLSHLNAPSLAHNLEARVRLGDIHTAAGSEVLVVINPCRPMPALYTKQMAARYAQDAGGQPPHIFGVAARAYKDMAAHGTSQALVISGESGAGKTETTKKAMQFFAQLAGGSGIEERVLESNPVLEAFGNAKTQRNHNSSRFGKLITLHFDKAGSHQLMGASIRTFLLEKSRVVVQLPGERSFHAFYQLVCGVSEQQRAALRLPAAPQDFAYLTQGNCTCVEGVDDAREFAQVVRCLQRLGLSQAEQDGLWHLLAAILWLGNVHFEAQQQQAGAATAAGPEGADAAGPAAAGAAAAAQEAAAPVPGEALANAAELLGVDAAALARAVTSRTIRVNGGVIVKPLLPAEAVDARDALAKALYAAAFDWLVERINMALGGGATSSSGGGSSRTGASSNGNSSSSSSGHINILDIFGFEVFESNSFEQLCINTANEHLQQQFNRHLLAAEQEEYLAEGLDVCAVALADNQDCLDLLDAAPPQGLGLLTLLDEQCRLGNSASDEQFLRTVEKQHKQHARFSMPRRAPGAFVVHHSAGAVQYSCEAFVAKNRDLLSTDLLELAASSSQPLVAAMPQHRVPQQQQQPNGKSGRQGAAKGTSPSTVGGRFVRQLRQLMASLDACGGLQFVRCIKPNAQLQPGVFDQAAVIHQLRCSGVLEVARIARSAYPTRMPIHAFISRYSRQLPGMHQWQTPQQLAAQPPAAACVALLEWLGVGPEQYLLGKARVFLRAGMLGLVEANWARLQRLSVLLQVCARRWRVRTRVRRQHRAATALQGAWRVRCACLQARELRLRHAAVLVLQTALRGWAARKQAAVLRQQRRAAAAALIQRAWRSHKLRQRLMAVCTSAVRMQMLARRMRLAQRLRARALANRAAHAAGAGQAAPDNQGCNGVVSTLPDEPDSPFIAAAGVSSAALAAVAADAPATPTNAAELLARLTEENARLERALAEERSMRLQQQHSAGAAAGAAPAALQAEGQDAQRALGSFDQQAPMVLKLKRRKLLQVLAAHDEAAQGEAAAGGDGMRMVWQLAAEFDATAAVMEDDLMCLQQARSAAAQWQRYHALECAWTAWRKTWHHNMASALFMLQHAASPASNGMVRTPAAVQHGGDSTGQDAQQQSRALEALLELGREFESWSGVFSFELQVRRPHRGSMSAELLGSPAAKANQHACGMGHGQQRQPALQPTSSGQVKRAGFFERLTRRASVVQT